MPTPPRRRWFQFSLGTLFWLMLATAFLVFGLNERHRRIETEASFASQLAQARKQAADEQRKRHRYQNENDKLRGAAKAKH